MCWWIGWFTVMEDGLVMNTRGDCVYTHHTKTRQVMRESARLGMTWLKAQMGSGGVGGGVLQRLVGPVRVRLDSGTDVHIHVPAGAIPKVSAVCVWGLVRASLVILWTEGIW